MFKKSFIILFLTAISLTITNNAEANMFNKFKKGFYFEKYDNAEEAKAALLEMHPIGSSVEGLVGTLEGAGAKCGIYRTEIEDYEDVFNSKKFWSKRQIEIAKEVASQYGDYYYCYYKHRPLFPIHWKIIVNIEFPGLTIAEIKIISWVDTI